MKPLYCFKLDEHTGKLSKFEVNEYEKVCLSKYTKRCAFFYKHTLGKQTETKYEVYECNLDKFVNWKVHTFNPDVEHVKRIILDALLERENKAQADLDRWQDARAEFEIENID